VGEEVTERRFVPATRRLFLYLLAAVLLASCSSQGARQSKPSQEEQRTKEVTHPNGLKVRLAESLTVEEVYNGFEIKPHGSESRRYPVEITVRLYSGQQKPSGEWPKEKRIGERIIKYRESRADAGGASGDQTIISLEAWEEVPSAYIFYTYTSPEPEEDANLGWRIIENTMMSRSQ
jgi:hypothetical protein